MIVKKYLTFCSFIIYVASTTIALSQQYTFNWIGENLSSILGATITVTGGNIVDFSGGNLIWKGVSEGSIRNFASPIPFDGISSTPYFTGALVFDSQVNTGYSLYYAPISGLYRLEDINTETLEGVLALSQ